MSRSLPFMIRERLKSVSANEGVEADEAIRLALDLYLLAPAQVRRQVADLQTLPPDRRRLVYSEIFDALDRGAHIVRAGGVQ